jgi:hypothetical protein
MRRLLPLAVVVAALAGGCNDPVHDDAVAALGPEDPNVPVGPLHRPGQPCLVCHDGGGPGVLVFGTAGTVYQDAMDPFPMVSATVTLTDAAGNASTPLTNCAGNFFVEAVDWMPAFPVHVAVSWGSVGTTMLSHMGKATSCAECHAGKTGSNSSVSQIYLNAAPLNPPPPTCK